MDPYVGMEVCKYGRTTGETCGTVVGTGTTLDHPVYGVLYEQADADYYVEPGDSGSPVYHGYYTDPIYGSCRPATYLVGLHLGKWKWFYQEFSVFST